MVTTAPPNNTFRTSREPDYAPELTLDALMARMRSAAQRNSSLAPAARTGVGPAKVESTNAAALLEAQTEFNQTLVSAVNAIAQHLIHSRTAHNKSASELPSNNVLLTRIEVLAAQVNDLAERLDAAIAALNATDQNHGTRIDAASTRLEMLCQTTTAAQQQAAAQLEALQQRIAAAQVAVGEVSQEVEASGRRVHDHLTASELRLLRLERDVRKNSKWTHAPVVSQLDAAVAPEPTEATDHPFDYFLFEHRFRGSTDDIKRRQQAYLEYFLQAEGVLDLGCGRGEFVELLAEHGIPVVGVDLNEDMIDFCKARGLRVLRGDLVKYLAAQENGSIGGIFISQVVEHLAADRVWKLIQLAAAKLKTDGILLLETINPQCFAAMSCFYLDPSHVRPYHPALLAFMCEQSGFRLDCIQFSAPLPTATTGSVLKSVEEVPPADAVHYQDYAVIARRTALPL